MLHLLVWPLLTFPQRSTLAFTLNLTFAEETLVNHPMDMLAPQHASPPRAEPPAQVEISSSSGTQSPPAQTETPTSPEMNSPQPETSSPSRVQSPIGQAKTPTLAEVNSSPLQPEASELPETAPTPSQTEASASPRAPPSPMAQEIPPETEQNLAPVQEVRHEVNACTQLRYLLYFPINYSWLGNVTLSGSNSIIIKPISGG
jgi:hypothetical protein